MASAWSRRGGLGLPSFFTGLRDHHCRSFHAFHQQHRLQSPAYDSEFFCSLEKALRSRIYALWAVATHRMGAITLVSALSRGPGLIDLSSCHEKTCRVSRCRSRCSRNKPSRPAPNSTCHRYFSDNRRFFRIVGGPLAVNALQKNKTVIGALRITFPLLLMAFHTTGRLRSVKIFQNKPLAPHLAAMLV